MATTAFKGSPVQTIGDLPITGAPLPAFDIVGEGLASVTHETGGKQLLLNIFPSIDTGVCAASVRRFNELAAGLDNTTVLNVSADLPFAQSRFCGAEGIENVAVGSTFRSTFGTDYGLTMNDGPLAGLLARAVIVADADGTVVHTELVPEITQEPNYDAAIAALS